MTEGVRPFPVIRWAGKKGGSKTHLHARGVRACGRARPASMYRRAHVRRENGLRCRRANARGPAPA